MKNIERTIMVALITLLIMGDKAMGQIGSPGLIYQGAFNNAMFLTTKSSIERGMKSAREANSRRGLPSARVAPNMNFTSSSKVEDKVLELIATIAANGDKSKVRSSAETIRKVNFMVQFENILRPYGLDRYNVPDVFTAFILLSWQAINGKDIGNYRKGVALFRKQIQNAMSYNSRLSEFSNDQKQEIAEILSYMAIFFTYASQEQSKKGDTASLAETRQNIRLAVIRVSGIDLIKYTFNNDGLVEN